jgi:hypothetical protein
MVGSRGSVRVLSALAGGTGRVPQIESTDDESLPELFPVTETPRQGLGDATLKPPTTWTQYYFHASLLVFEMVSRFWYLI